MGSPPLRLLPAIPARCEKDHATGFRAAVGASETFFGSAQESDRPPDFTGFRENAVSGCVVSRMRLNCSGANADRRFVAIHGSPGRPALQWRGWRCPSASNRRARSDRVGLRPARFLREPRVRVPRRKPLPLRALSLRGKLLNLHRISDFRPRSWRAPPWEGRLQPNQPSASTCRRAGSPPTGRSRQDRRPPTETRIRNPRQ